MKTNIWKEKSWTSTEDVSVAQNLTTKISAPVEVFDNLLKTFKYDVISVANARQAAFQHLVKFDNANLTHQLIKYIENINSQDENGNTLLHIAAQNKNDLICTSLICSGKIDMKIVNKEGKSVLHVASEVGCINAVKIFLLQKNLNVNLRDYLKFTPLHYALLNGHDEVAMLLLSFGANIAAETYRKESGYHLALAKNCTKVIQKIEANRSLTKIKMADFVTIYGNTILHYINSIMLLNQIWNFDVERLRDKDNCRRETPVYSACARGNSTLLRYFIEKRACQVMTNVGESLFHMAIRNDSVDIVSVLKRFYNGNEKNKFDINCLESAAIYGSNKIALMLANYSKEYKNSLHKNIFKHYAAVGCRTLEQKQELELDPKYENFFLPNKYGLSPYLYLILYNKHDVVKYIIDEEKKQSKCCANLYRVNPITGNTELHYAVKSKSCAMVELISTNLPTHVNMPNNNSKTPLNLAAIQNDPLMVKILLQGFRKINFVVSSTDTSVIDCIKNNSQPNILLLAMLLDAGCNVNNVVDNTTALVLAVENQNENVVAFLLGRNANVHFLINPNTKKQNMFNEITTDEKSYFNYMLHMAAEKENTEITQDLLTYGARDMINRYNSLGLTPLHCALIYKNYKQVSLLLTHGANFNLQVKGTEDTPLHLAARSGHKNLVMLLLKFRPKVCLNKNCYTASVIAASEGFADIVDLLYRYEQINKPTLS